MRPSGRTAEQVRPIKITRNYTKHAEGSVLIEQMREQIQNIE